MDLYGWLQLALFLGLLLLVTRPMGVYLYRVLDPQGKTFLDPLLKPVERLFYRLMRVDPRSEQDWKRYAVSLLLFSLVGTVFTYAILRLQHLLPLNPQRLGPVSEPLAFNTAVSFVTNTNWQNYGGESTMSYLSQMVALVLHNFTSAASGIAVAAALVRGIARHTAGTVGNFLVDLVRVTLYLLLPVCLVYAVFLVSQQETPQTEQILLNAIRNDPDPEVQEQAVFWLSQVGSERAVSALDSILQTSKNEAIQEKAIFALSQMDNPRASAIIRSYAQRAGAPLHLREQAIFWLGQEGGSQNEAFLRALYKQLKEQDLKEKVIFSISQMEGPETQRWLMNLALDPSEPIETRKQALFWAGQSGVSITELAAFYARTKDTEMKEQVIFVYSQRDEKAAFDQLLEIAKREPNLELRKKAIFWLSQSDDPRAAQFLEDLIQQ